MRKLTKILALLCAFAIFVATVSLASLANEDGKHWVGSWSVAMSDVSVKLLDDYKSFSGISLAPFAGRVTVRTRITPTLGGDRIRVCLSNENGLEPMAIEKVSIAYAGEQGSDIVKPSATTLLFNGEQQVVIPAGETVYCDPVDMKITALEDISLSCYVKDFAKVQTMALWGGETYLTLGDHTEERNFTGAGLTFGTLVSIVPIFVGLDVYADSQSYSIVVIGDSTMSNDIPILLTERIINETGENKVGILQKSILGNRLLHDGVGPVGSLYGKALIDRFQRDALEQPGVRYSLVKIGINDILHPLCDSMSGLAPAVTPEEINTGYKLLCEMAKGYGVNVVFAELTPWKGYTRDLLKTGNPDLEWSEEAQETCDAVNEYIRTGDYVEGYVCLDSLRDPEDVNKLPDGYSNDGIHFLGSAQEAFVNAIDLSLFGIKTNDDGDGDVNEDGQQENEPAKPQEKIPAYEEPAQPSPAPSASDVADRTPAAAANDTMTGEASEKVVAEAPVNTGQSGDSGSILMIVAVVVMAIIITLPIRRKRLSDI